MASPNSPTAYGGAAGSETMARTSTRAALSAAAALIEDKTMTSLTSDTDKDTCMDSVSQRSVANDSDLSFMSYASSSLERFSKDIQSLSVDMSLDADFSSSQRGRKRKHSDDPPTAVASGASTPGRHASPNSHLASYSSTPPSSIPSTSASPLVTKHSEDDDPDHTPSDDDHPSLPTQSRGQALSDHFPKRTRVYEVQDDLEDDEDAVVVADDRYGNDGGETQRVNGYYSDGRVVNRPSHAGSADNDHDDYNDGDYSSNRADDGDSVVELNGTSSTGSTVANRGTSPAPTQVSDDSDATVTPANFRRPSTHRSSAQRIFELQAREPADSQHAALVIEDHPDVEEVIEVIDLTRPRRRNNYPQNDTLPRVPGLSPQHSFSLPTLQRLVSRSSESVERSQSRRPSTANNSIDVHEIPDDDEDENDGDDEGDRYGNNTVRIDSEVREVQLDPHHPWARGPVQLILSQERPQERSQENQYLEDQRQRQLEDAIVVDDHLTQIDYEDVESDSEAEEVAEMQEVTEVEDDGVTEQQVNDDINWILSLRRSSPPSPPRMQQRGESSRSHRSPFQARTPQFQAHTYSFEARPSPFPSSPRRSATPGSRSHRFTPVARRPSPVPLILRSTSQPMTSPPPPASTTSAQSHSSAFAAGASATPKALKYRQGEASDESQKQESWARQHLRCSICMEVMSLPTMVRCGHAFCRDCILRALDVAKICPMCRMGTTKHKLQELEFFEGRAGSTGPGQGGSMSGATAAAATGLNGHSNGHGNGSSVLVDVGDKNVS
ncbi:hypothetical protein BGZ99_004236 [Dissophora globulifera]|uniref:RING-type domain-containing protein n=1 Tax=Dissophora globulifera TaxID=979702 RepID=A0A9P6UV18_9FUNG|nr:hypothetical protein BGZ99_004236 [Dissophora globulifera]